VVWPFVHVAIVVDDVHVDVVHVDDDIIEQEDPEHGAEQRLEDIHPLVQLHVRWYDQVVEVTALGDQTTQRFDGIDDCVEVNVLQIPLVIAFTLQDAEAAPPYHTQVHDHLPFTGTGESIGTLADTVQRFAYCIWL